MCNFDILDIKADRSDNPLQLYWAGSNNPMELHVFRHLNDWKDFISRLSLNCHAPLTVKYKYERAQNLYFLAWVNLDIIKAGELAAITALELALRDVYAFDYKELYPKKKTHSFLREGLKFMVDSAGLTDEKLPIFQKSGGSVVNNLYGNGKNQHGNLVSIRNSFAHGDAFDAMPWASLLEVVRDLIDYMYRDYQQNP